MFQKTDILLDILDLAPAALNVMRAYEHASGDCICCDMLFSSIEDIASHYRLDLNLLLERLNSAG